MALPDKTIDPRLIESAKIEFMEKGYDRASINVICKNAGVTTGALFKRFSSKEDLFFGIVNPALNPLKQWFIDESDKFFSQSMSLQKQAYHESEYPIMLMDYMYEHLAEFKLMVNCSSPSQFADFLDFFVEMETENMLKMLELFKPDALQSGSISKDSIHILTSSYFNGIFEVVRHDFDKEEAIRFVKQIIRFYKVGWADILKL